MLPAKLPAGELRPSRSPCGAPANLTRYDARQQRDRAGSDSCFMAAERGSLCYSFGRLGGFFFGTNASRPGTAAAPNAVSQVCWNSDNSLDATEAAHYFLQDVQDWLDAVSKEPCWGA